MDKRKRSKAWFIEHDMLQNIINESSTIVEICNKVDINPYNGSSKPLRDRIVSGEFDLVIFNNNRKIFRRDSLIKLHLLSTLNLQDYLTTSSNLTRSTLKRKIIEQKLIPYICDDCGNNGYHNSKRLSLQIEHINGVNNDNRLENLCFLCPNCHSQTETYAGKKNKKEKIYESTERKNERISKIRKFEIERDELERLINSTAMTTIGKYYGVSDNAIRKRCKILNIDLPKKKPRK